MGITIPVPGIQGITGITGVTGIKGVTGITGVTGLQGLTGVTGAQGIQGITGMTGVTGAQGVTGVQGIAGAGVAWKGAWDTGVSYSINDGVSYQNSSYISKGNTNQGNLPTDTSKWDIWVAQGTQGLTGITGVTGAQGIRGLTGITGVTGAQGIQGLTGITGVTGAQGIQGLTGITGVTGTQGIQGLTGITGVTGAQGIQGLTGMTGVTGAQGIQGITGMTGVTGIQGIQGLTGITGITGVTGAQGIQGLTGITGVTGAQGIQGLTGITGITGVTGTQGIQGLTGMTGVTGAGIQGITGITGVTGAQGIQGLTGVTGLRGLTGVTGLQGLTGVTGAAGSGKLAFRLYVGTSATADFTTVKAAVDWFNASATSNTEILIDAGHFNIADTVTVNNSSYALQIRGLGEAVTILDAATGLTGKPMFNIKSACDVDKITCNASTLASYGTLANENCFTFNTTSGLSPRFYDFNINNFKIGIADLIGTNLIAYEFIVNSCGVGISQNHSTAIDTFLDVETCNFVACPIGIQLLKATSASFSLINIEFINSLSTDVGIAYTGGAGNYVLDSTAAIQDISGCMYNEVGTFMSGFDFSLARDSSIAVTGNVGTEDKKPHAKINVLDNVTTTTITTAGTYYKVGFTNGLTYTCKMTLADGRMTYLSGLVRDGVMWFAGNASVNHNAHTMTFTLRKSVAITSVSGNGTTVTVTTTNNHHLSSGQTVQMLGWTGGTGTWNGVYVVNVTGNTTFTYLATGNGTATGGTTGALYAPMSLYATTANLLYSFAFTAYIDGMQYNDVYDLYATSSNSADVITLSDLTWYLDTR